MKIGIIGAGNVGSTLAMRVLEAGIGDVALVDIAEGLAEGKAIDISDASAITGSAGRIVGSADFSVIKNSDAVVITAGFPRKPGMSRDELIFKNRKITEGVAKTVSEKCPDAVVVVVTNPLDMMTYLAFRTGGFKKNKIMGMAGTLDAARFVNVISEKLNVPAGSVKTYVLGSHGDTMVPLVSNTLVNRKPLADLMPQKDIDSLVEKTKKRGAEVVSLLRTSSAYYSPSAGCFQLLKAIKGDTKEILCVSAYLEGEYGEKNIFIGVPAKIGRNGIEKIVELEMDTKEMESFRASAKVIKEAIGRL